MNRHNFFNLKTSLFLLQLLCFTTIYAAPKKSESVISKTLLRYSEAAGVRAQFIKTDAKKTLGTKKSVLGEMRYSDNKINIVLNGDKKTEIIYNGNNLWLIEYPDLDFDPKGKRKVTEIQDHKPVLAQQIVGLFQKPEQFLKQRLRLFLKKTEGKDENHWIWSRKIKRFRILLSNLILHKLSHQLDPLYIDDVQTETKIEFKETEFLKTPPLKDIFNYSNAKKMTRSCNETRKL
jgi:hypothetical protein